MEGSGEGKGRVAAAPMGGGGYGAYEVAGERKWWPWLVPTIIVACIAIFVFEMWVNDCPKHGSALGADAGCVAGFLRRFYFQPLHENPLHEMEILLRREQMPSTTKHFPCAADGRSRRDHRPCSPAPACVVALEPRCSPADELACPPDRHRPARRAGFFRGGRASMPPHIATGPLTVQISRRYHLGHMWERYITLDELHSLPSSGGHNGAWSGSDACRHIRCPSAQASSPPGPRAERRASTPAPL